MKVSGKLGRTWGANSNASFINVETNGTIDDAGWGEMNSGDKATAIFNEYNLTSNGQAYSSTGAVNKNIEAAVANYIDTKEVSAVNTVLGSWVPVHYEFVSGGAGFKDEPATEAPATEAPTTEAPTTEAPTPEASTTKATEAPTTTPADASVDTEPAEKSSVVLYVIVGVVIVAAVIVVGFALKKKGSKKN